jgi:urea transport system permease protein
VNGRNPRRPGLARGRLAPGTPGWFAPALACALVLVAALATATAARAQEVGATLQRFTLDRFPDTQRAVEELALSGHPHAPAILEALGDNRLAWRPADRRVVWREPPATWRDALTGEPADGAGARVVRINNNVRRAIEAAGGVLGLLAPGRRDAAVLPALDAALARESDGRVRAVMAQARASILLGKADAPEAERVGAVATIAARADRDALTLLRTIPQDAPGAVKDAAARATSAIETRLAIIEVGQNVFFGLSLGSVLLLAAIGLAITFGVMGVINMAHGEMVMIGAYATFLVQETIRANAPHLFDHSLFVALPVAFLAAALVGVAIERSVIRFLYGRPLETLLATWGVSLILQQAVRSLFGPTNREVGNPGFMSGTADVFGMALTWNRIWIVVFAALVFTALLLTLKYTALGLRMRAVVQNRRMASSMGIRTDRIDALTFGLGSGIAGIAGVALSQIDNVSPNLGQGYIIDSFMVVVFGGVGNLWGTLVAALSLGVANKLLEPVTGAVLGKIVVLVLIILFIQRRPRGLFALKGRAVEQ